jgi:predicted O-methyltransferase YrrM
MSEATLQDMRRLRLRVLGSLLLRGRPPWRGSSSATELLYLARTAQRTNARLIGEIGFNAGLSSHAFLEAHPDVQVISFDLCETRSAPASKIAKKMIDERFPGRHTLICGDSRLTVPEFKASNPGLCFDLVFIDGGHSYECARADLLNMRELSSKDTAVIVDDLVPQFRYGAGPAQAWSDAVEEGLLHESEVVKDGKMRAWGLGQYVFKGAALAGN